MDKEMDKQDTSAVWGRGIDRVDLSVPKLMIQKSLFSSLHFTTFLRWTAESRYNDRMTIEYVLLLCSITPPRFLEAPNPRASICIPPLSRNLVSPDDRGGLQTIELRPRYLVP